MGQGFDVAALNPAYRMRILQLLLGKTMPVMEQVFGVTPTRQKSGEIPFMPSKYLVGQVDDADITSVGIDDVAQDFDASLSSASFNIKSKYAKRGHVHKLAADALEETTAAGIVQTTGQIAATRVAAAIDLDGKAYISNTSISGVGTINDSVSAEDDWDDPTSSTVDPWNDFDDAMDKVGAANIVWLGLDRARKLTALPAFKAEFHRFNGTNARVSMRGVVDTILARYPNISDVVIDDNWYNTANMQASASYSRIFDGVVWVGTKEHMKLVEATAHRKFRSWLEEDSDNYYSELVRYLTWARPDAKAGCLITGTAA